MPHHVLVVSSYPPVPCGIAAYAEQQVERLRGEGKVVDVFAFPGGEADHVCDLRGGWGIFKGLWKVLWGYDEVFFHYVPNFFYSAEDRRDRARTSLALLCLTLLYGRRMRFVIHETDYKIDEAVVPFTPKMQVDRWTWLRMGKVIFHSLRERDAFVARYRLNPRAAKYEVVAHDRDFVSRCAATREEARDSLGLPREGTMLLCIGFVQPHKGYDRVVRALAAVPEAKNLFLRIVGSVRIAWQPALDFARLLHEECAKDPRAEFVERFVDNEEFDRWIVASDYVVVPYHEIWSSGVAARAKLHGRPVVVSDTGALAEQMTPGSHSFKTDEELVGIVRKIAAERA